MQTPTRHAALRAELQAWRRFVQQESHVLRAAPGLLPQQAANQPEDSPVSATALRDERLEQRCWLRWLNKRLRRDPCLLTLTGHTAYVSHLAVSGDGATILSASGDATARLWDARSGQERAVLSGHGGPVRSALFTPDGKRIVTGSADHTLKLWDAESGILLQTLTGHEAGITALLVTPDGRHLFSGCDDGTLRMWNLDGGGLMGTFRGDRRTLQALAMGRTPQEVITGSWSGAIVSYDLATRRKLLELWHPGGAWMLALTRDGTRLVSGGPRLLKVWALDPPAELHVLQGHTDLIEAMAVTADGRRVISASKDCTLRLWDLDRGAELHRFTGHTAAVKAVATTPDSRRAVSASWDGTLKLWDLDSGRELGTLAGHSGFVMALALAPGGQQIVSGGFDNTVKVWDADAPSGAAEPPRPVGALSGIAITRDRSRVVTGGWDNTLRIWEGTSGAPLGSIVTAPARVTVLDSLTGPRELAMHALALTADDRYIAAGYSDGTVAIWDFGGRRVRELRGHTREVRALAASGRGRLCSGSSDGTLCIWNVAGGRLERTIPTRTAVRAVAATPDGSIVVSAGFDGALAAWDASTGNPVRSFHGHTAHLGALAISPDGRCLLSGDWQGEIRVWDLQGGTELFQLRGHRGSLQALAVSSDGAYLISASADRTLLVWSLAERAGLTAFPAAGAITCAATNGRLVAAGDESGAFYLFELRGVPLAVPVQRSRRPWWRFGRS